MGQTNEEEVQENQETPPPKCQSTSLISPTSSTGIHLQACILGTSMMPIGIPPSGEITLLQSAADQQLNAGGHELMEQNSTVNYEHSRAIQPRTLTSYSTTLIQRNSERKCFTGTKNSENYTNENCPTLSKRTFRVPTTATRRHRKGYV